MAVREIVRNARKNDGVPKTAQQSIPFDRMFPDGICRVGLDYYTKTIQFQDINYQLAQQEDKTEIFEEWCSFLNFFDSSVRFQLSFDNMAKLILSIMQRPEKHTLRIENPVTAKNSMRRIVMKSFFTKQQKKHLQNFRTGKFRR